MEQRGPNLGTVTPLTRRQLREAQQAKTPPSAVQPAPVMTRAMMRQQRLEEQGAVSPRETPTVRPESQLSPPVIPESQQTAPAVAETRESRSTRTLSRRGIATQESSSTSRSVQEPTRAATTTSSPAVSRPEPLRTVPVPAAAQAAAAQLAQAQVAPVEPVTLAPVSVLTVKPQVSKRVDLGSSFDRVPSLDVDLSAPQAAMCAEHAQEAESYSHRDPHSATVEPLPSRSSLRKQSSASVLQQRVGRSKPVRATSTGAVKHTSKVAVLVSLALATVATPMALAQESDLPLLAEEEPTAQKIMVGPSTLDVVGSSNHLQKAPFGIAQPTSLDDRVVQVASRSDERTPFSGCDASVEAAGSNGQLRQSDLCEVLPGYSLRADAAVGFLALSEAYQDRFGERICLVSGYRTLASQHTLKRQKGSLAATPGTSNHGWGLAIDICNNSYHAQNKWTWLNENAPRFGWAQPSWASRSYEPWHWEYTAGVESK